MMSREGELKEERNRLLRLRSLLASSDQTLQFLEYGCGPYAVIPRRGGGVLNLSSSISLFHEL